MFQLIFSTLMTFIIPAFVISGIISFFIGNKKEQYSPIITVIAGFGISPLFMSLILYFVINLLPLRSEFFYLYTVTVIALLPGCLFYKYSIEVWKSFIKCILDEVRQMPRNFYYICFYIMVICLIGYVFVQGIFFPIGSHDGDAYFLFSKLFLRDFNPDCYPMTGCDITGFFFYGPWHPPALPLIYVWLQISSGIHGEIICRAISPIYSFYLLLIVYFSMRNEKYEYSPILVCLLLLLTPLFVWQSYQNSIDPLRWFIFYLSFYMFYVSFNKSFPSFKECFLLGFIIGLMLYLHISSVLAAFSVMAGIGVFVLWKLLKKKQLSGNIYGFLWKMLLIGMLALIFGGYEYFKNYREFGNVMGPNTNYALLSTKLNISSVNEAEIFKKKSHKEMPYSTRMQIFLKPYIYGILFYIFLAAVFILFCRKRTDDSSSFKAKMLLLIMLFSIPVIYRFYGNRRYIGTVLPFVACFSGLVFECYIRSLFTTYKKFISVICISMLILCVSVFLFFNNEIKSIFSGRNVITILSASKKEQNEALFPDFNKAVDFTINNTDKSSKFIVSDTNLNFHMTAERYGLIWTQIETIAKSNDPKDIYEAMRENKIEYVLLDPLAQYYYVNLWETFDIMLKDPDKFDLIFNKETKIWKIKAPLF